MLPVSETIFWVTFIIICYTYFGYPLILLILNGIKNLLKKSSASHPFTYGPVTVLVAAFNEEAIIEEKILNCLAIEYPPEKIKYVFVTDGSSDRTGEIIRKYPSIIHLHETARRGKLAAINRAMLIIDTPLVVFSDANTFINPESISLLVRHYADPRVGAVSGEKRVYASGADDTVGKGEGFYWKYESFLKKLDSRLYSIVGAAGELFSLRSELYKTLPENIVLDDFVQSLSLCADGHVVQYEPGAVAMEKGSLSVKDEMERKVRISAGGFQAMAYLKKLFNVFRYPILSFQYISHRVLRWTLCPIALVVLFLANIVLWYGGGGVGYGYFALLQTIFYLLAFAGWLLARSNRNPGPFYLPFYVVFMHFCVFGGFARYVRGRQEAAWKKAAR